MFVFATAEPYGAYHLEPLLSQFAAQALHLVPDTNRETDTPEVFPVTRDLSALTSASALIITGGAINDWTESCAIAAAAAGTPVYYVELTYAHGAPFPRSTQWLSRAFCGSEYSQSRLSRHLGVGAEQITVIGYPYLDGLHRDGLPPAGTKAPHVLVLGTIENPAWDRLNAAVTDAFRSLGCQVTERHHPRANPAPQQPLATQLRQVDLVVGAPDIAYLAAATMHIPLWCPQHESIPREPDLAHLASLAHPVPVNTLDELPAELATALATYTPINPDIIEHYLGPRDSRASERLRMHLLLDDVINLGL